MMMSHRNLIATAIVVMSVSVISVASTSVVLPVAVKCDFHKATGALEAFAECTTSNTDLAARCKCVSGLTSALVQAGCHDDKIFETLYLGTEFVCGASPQCEVEESLQCAIDAAKGFASARSSADACEISTDFGTCVMSHSCAAMLPDLVHQAFEDSREFICDGATDCDVFSVESCMMKSLEDTFSSQELACKCVTDAAACAKVDNYIPNGVFGKAVQQVDHICSATCDYDSAVQCVSVAADCVNAGISSCECANSMNSCIDDTECLLDDNQALVEAITQLALDCDASSALVIMPTLMFMIVGAIMTVSL